MEPKYKIFFECLKQLLEIAHSKYESICESENADPKIVEYCRLAIQGLDSLEYQLKSWTYTLPIISFNGSKYDINLMKQYLFKSLNDLDETVFF